MDKIKMAATRTKRFVNNHKVGIAVTVTSACWIAINRATFAEFQNFLDEKGLTDEFMTGDFTKKS